MTRILTITMNPSIDVSTHVERVIAGHKLRCGPSRRDPGGGGINVARVLRRLGVDAVAFYTAGGERGQMLRRMLAREGIEGVSLPISDDTREDFTVDEMGTGNEFRFVSVGPELSENEWRAALALIADFRAGFAFIVASGSLPPGVPDDFYARVADIAHARGTPIALDASGAALRGALRGGVEVLKPSLSELRELSGLSLGDPSACRDACRALIDRGHAKLVALTLGSQGAILVSADDAWRAWPLSIQAVSTVGAGDSFLGAMIASLAMGQPPEDAFRRAVAAGSAALLAPGTQLCLSEDVDALESKVHIDRVP